MHQSRVQRGPRAFTVSDSTGCLVLLRLPAFDGVRAGGYTVAALAQVHGFNMTPPGTL
jgi:hypothetical protein